MALDRIEIDWADDGYQHASADVSNDVREYSVSFGMNGSSSPFELVNRAARGQMTLENAGQEYGAETSTRYTRQQLLKRHACRITSVSDSASDKVLWEGFAGVPAVDARSGSPRARVQLQGRLLPIYQEGLEVSVSYDAFVHWHIERMFATIGPAFLHSRNYCTGAVTWPLQQSDYSGTVLGFLNALCDFSGAWGLEDRHGYFAMYEYLSLNDLPRVATVDASDIFLLHGPTRVWDRHEMVRNSMQIESAEMEIATKTEPDSIAVYGPREQRMPPFARDRSFYALCDIEWLRTWLVMRSTPIKYAEITMDRNQAKRQEIERIGPGEKFKLKIDGADGIDVDNDFWCCGCTLERQYSSPSYLHVQAVSTSLAREDVVGFPLGRGILGSDHLGSTP